MSRREKRKSLDLFFGESLFEDIEDVFERLEKGSLAESGYSISVTQGPDGTKVYAKAGKDIDVERLRRKLQQRYPKAEIHIEGGRPLIREVSSKVLDDKEKEEG